MGKWPLAANQWQDGVAMKNPKPHRWRAKASLVCLLLGTAATLSLTESQVEAAPVPLTQSDLELDIFASDGSSWHQLTAGTLAGYFGAHRCSCPVTLSPIVGLTTSGKATQSAAGNSSRFDFYLRGGRAPHRRAESGARGRRRVRGKPGSGSDPLPQSREQ